MRLWTLPLVVLLASELAYPGNCGIGESPCKAADRMDLVFVGNLEREDLIGDKAFYTLSVKEVLKGAVPPLVEICTRYDCVYHNGYFDYGFKVGETYLVFAFVSEDGRLVTDECSKPRPIRDTAALLPQLRSFAARGSAASVFGTLEKYMGTYDVKKRLGQFAGREIRAVSDQGTYRTVTAADGTYEFKDLPAGLYEFTPDLTGHVGAGSYLSSWGLCGGEQLLGNSSSCLSDQRDIRTRN